MSVVGNTVERFLTFKFPKHETEGLALVVSVGVT